jgi:hypothetical protein
MGQLQIHRYQKLGKLQGQKFGKLHIGARSLESFRNMYQKVGQLQIHRYRTVDKLQCQKFGKLQKHRCHKLEELQTQVPEVG